MQFYIIFKYNSISSYLQVRQANEVYLFKWQNF